MRRNGVKRVVYAGVLAALSVVLSLYPFTFYLTESIRISFREVPILLASIALGPLFGGLCAFIADLCGTLVTGLGWNPILTIPAVLIGVLPGLLFRLFAKRMPTLPALSLSIGLTDVCVPILLTTLLLSLLYGQPYLVLLAARTPLYLVMALIQTFAAFWLLPILKRGLTLEEPA